MSARESRSLNNLAVTFAPLVLALFSAQGLHAGNGPYATYLALGDSVAYGLNVLLLTQSPPPVPADFVGYPEVLADQAAMSKKVVDLSCPGESSASFYIPGAPDYGCHDNGPQGQPPFKTWIGLHTNYPGTQLEFAVSELQSNKHINLVTLGIGANDLLLLLKSCGTDDACVATGLPVTLGAYGQNLAAILTGIRQTAGYKGKLVIVLQYSPQAQLTPLAVALNQVTVAASAGFDVTYADGFTAFQLASLPSGGDPCAAGLLVNLGAAGCDIHPSLKGQQILAATVLAVTGGKL